MNTISIIVAIYNVEDYLDKCLKSIKYQTFSNYVCYCVNDGSTDGSESIINRYLDDPRFIILDKSNGGLSDARNYGLKYVDTEYVMFVDGDDYLEKNLLQEAMNRLNDSNADLFVFGYNQAYLSNNKIERIDLNIENGIYSLKEKRELLAFTPNAAWNKIYKTSLFKNNNIEYPFGYRHQDLGTTGKLLLKANKIEYYSEPLYNYIIDRPNNITSQVDNKLYHIIDMCKEIIDYYKKENIFNEYKQELEYLVKANCIQSLRKAMNIKDKKFVYKFIDDIFELFDTYFIDAKHTYYDYFDKHDKVYLSKIKCKLYYLI